jgi:hypothetical protein
MNSEAFFSTLKQGVAALLVLGLLVYAVMLGLYAVNPGWSPEFMRNPSKGQYIFGLPLSGITAFAIVCVLERISPAQKDKDGTLSFKAFGLEFSGPAGPVTLWVVCYLVLVASMRIVA